MYIVHLRYLQEEILNQRSLYRCWMLSCHPSCCKMFMKWLFSCPACSVWIKVLYLACCSSICLICKKPVNPHVCDHVTSCECSMLFCFFYTLKKMQYKGMKGNWYKLGYKFLVREYIFFCATFKRTSHNLMNVFHCCPAEGSTNLPVRASSMSITDHSPGIIQTCCFNIH